MKNYLTKKNIIVIITAALLSSLFILPIRCTDIFKEIKMMSDVGSLEASRTCYSIYHKSFWTTEKGQTIEFLFGLSAIRPLTDAYKLGYVDQVDTHGLRGVSQTVIHHLYPADFSNDGILIGASHNIFIGKVISQVGNTDFVGSPATQYSVEVISNIKGDLNGTIIVNQEGGLRDGVLYLAEENGKLLERGSTYLLATRYDSENDSYTLNPHPNASKLITSESSLGVKDLRVLADKDPKVKTFKTAYLQEKLLEADVFHSNTRNNFQSLTPEAKAAAQARADGREVIHSESPAIASPSAYSEKAAVDEGTTTPQSSASGAEMPSDANTAPTQ